MRTDQDHAYTASCPACNNPVEVTNPLPGHRPLVVTHVGPIAGKGRQEIETAYCDECDLSFTVYFQYGV
jgi:hypothetical protein